jgi:Tfp pilus assembly protein PilX
MKESAPMGRPQLSGRRALFLLTGESGSLIIIALSFVVVFLILGVALYTLIISQTHATELERTDVKAFNVAEAGIDAGMLRLKQGWPAKSDDAVATNDPALTTALRDAIRAGTTALWTSGRAGDSQATLTSLADKFITVQLYDNVTLVGGSYQTTTVPDPSAPAWDSNTDGYMFVDALASVDNDRHRILVLAQLQKWQLNFSPKLALWANVATSNGQGLGVTVENPYPAPTIPYAYYEVHDPQGKGIDPQYAVAASPNTTTFDNVFPESLRGALEALAKTQGTYFTTAAAATTFLLSGQAGGKVVYLKSTTAVTIAGSSQVGSVDDPVVMVIDTPNGSVNGWDFRGTADFYGILITIGDSELRGTSGIHGALYCSGTLADKGNGSSEEINYNQQVINNINGLYPISVNIVPNTWEEYTPSAS